MKSSLPWKQIFVILAIGFGLCYYYGFNNIEQSVLNVAAEIGEYARHLVH